MHDLRVAFVGSAVSETALAGYPAASVAGNKYQLGLIVPLMSRVSRVDAFVIEPVSMFSGSGRVLIGSGLETLAIGLHARRLPFVNVIGLKQLTIAISVLLHLLNWARRQGGESRRNILVYNSLAYVAFPARVAAWLTRSRLVLILADVPLPRHEFSLLHELEDWAELRLIRHADAIVALTEQAAQNLGCGKPYLIIEGGWSPSGVASESAEDTDPHEQGSWMDPRRVVFAGTLNAVSGIELAIAAATGSHQDHFTLHIFGSGPLQSIVDAASAQHPDQITYHGRVSHEVVYHAEVSAGVLVCPRLPDGYITRYTFPSKLVEYMAAGVPVVVNRLEGLPKEYLPYVNIPEDTTPASWAELICEIVTDRTGGYQSRARRASVFIKTQRNWDVQVTKLAAFLGSSDG